MPGKIKNRHSNPLIAQYLARVALAKAMQEPAWKMSEAATTDKHMLIGNGDLAAPIIPPEITPVLSGKPLSKKQKRLKRQHDAIVAANAAFANVSNKE